MFVPDKPFQSSLMLAGKSRSLPSEAPFKCSTLSYVRKKFYRIGPRTFISKLFSIKNDLKKNRKKFFEYSGQALQPKKPIINSGKNLAILDAMGISHKHFTAVIYSCN